MRSAGPPLCCVRRTRTRRATASQRAPGDWTHTGRAGKSYRCVCLGVCVFVVLSVCAHDSVVSIIARDLLHDCVPQGLPPVCVCVCARAPPPAAMCRRCVVSVVRPAPQITTRHGASTPESLTGHGFWGIRSHGMRASLLALAAAVGVTSAYNNGVGKLPPMGWNTWCTDGVCAADIVSGPWSHRPARPDPPFPRPQCTQDELISVTDSIIAQGLDKLGYQCVCARPSARGPLQHPRPTCARRYILMDDCWSANTRDANGNLQPNATQFPKGFPFLVGARASAFHHRFIPLCRRRLPPSRRCDLWGWVL